jgi:hypothetical protein
VNFMVPGYIPPGKIERSWFTSTDITFRMIPIYSKSVLIVYSGAASRYVRPAKFLSVVPPRHTKGTTEHSGPIPKFARVDYFGQTCTKTLRSLCSDAEDVRNMGISILETLCH